MGDFRIQSFECSVAAADSQTDITIPLPVTTAKTRVLMASPGSQMQVTLPEGGTLNTRDLQVAIELVDSVTVRIHSSPNKRWPGVVSFSLMEYTGATGGANEFSVKRTAVINPLGSNGVDLTALEFQNEAPATTTTHIVGVILDNTVGSDTDGDYHGATRAYPVTRFITDFDTLDEYQVWIGNSNHAVWIYVEQVVWSGSNWTIGFAPFDQGTTDRADTITFTTAGGSGKSVTVPSFVWENTWIEQVRGVDLFTSAAVGEIGSHIYPDLASSTVVIAFTPAAGDTTNAATNGATFYAISNPENSVSHQGDKLGNGNSEWSGGTMPTFQTDVSDDPGKVAPPPSSGFSILAGSFQGANGVSDASVQYNGDGTMSNRRSRGSSDLLEYVQTIQLGAETDESGTMEDLVIRQPEISVAIRNK